MEPYYVSWDEYRGLARRHIAPHIKAHRDVKAIYAIPNGGVYLAADIGRLLGMPIRCVDPRGSYRFGRRDYKYMVVDDIIDTGDTMRRVVGRCNSDNLVIACLYATCKNQRIYKTSVWGEIIPDRHQKIVFPWVCKLRT